MIARPAFRAVLLGAALSAASGSVRADAWHEHYGRGLDLLARGEAAAAEAELRAALARRPNSGCRARVVGVLSRQYLPHYHLGLALQAQGKDAEAAVELSRELAQGVIPACDAARPQLADLRSRLSALALGEPRHATGPAAPVPAAGAPASPAAAAAPASAASGGGPPDAGGAPRGEAAVAAASAEPSVGSRAALQAGEPARASAARAAPPRVLRVRVRPLLALSWSEALGLRDALLPPASR